MDFIWSSMVLCSGLAKVDRNYTSTTQLAHGQIGDAPVHSNAAVRVECVDHVDHVITLTGAQPCAQLFDEHEGGLAAVERLRLYPPAINDGLIKFLTRGD